jgi:hypothetical protein
LVEKVSMELELCMVSPVFAWKWTVKVSAMPRGMAVGVSRDHVCSAGLVLKRT